MPFADISFGLYPPFKGREERKQKCLYRHYKRKHPLQAPPTPPLAFLLFTPMPLPPLVLSVDAQVGCHVCWSVPERLRK